MQSSNMAKQAINKMGVKSIPRVSKAIRRLWKEASRPQIVKPVFTSDEFVGIKTMIQKQWEIHDQMEKAYKQAVAVRTHRSVIQGWQGWEDCVYGRVYGESYTCEDLEDSHYFDPWECRTEVDYLAELSDDAAASAQALEDEYYELKEDYETIPTYTAEEKSQKEFKKDRKRWNHVPTKDKSKDKSKSKSKSKSKGGFKSKSKFGRIGDEIYV